MSQPTEKSEIGVKKVADLAGEIKKLAASRVPPPEEVARCLCGGHSKIYVLTTTEGRRFAACPACNPRLHCQHCGGTGHLTHRELDTGVETILPHACDCLITERQIDLLNRSGIPEKYYKSEFSLADLYSDEENPTGPGSKYADNMERVYAFCDDAHRFIVDGVSPRDLFFLTMVGPVGTGKTHLAVCALKRIVTVYGHACRFIDFQALLGQIRDSYSKRSSEEEIMHPLRTTDVLVIDEFGKGRSENEWELEKLDDLVNFRYNNGKVTIITTNYLPPELHVHYKRTLRAEAAAGQANSGDVNMDDVPAFLRDSFKQGEKPVGTNPYWIQTLPQRIGERMYDRIIEVSVFVDFLEIPSFRRRLAEDFFEEYRRFHKER